jgi:hypothetical protein
MHRAGTALCGATAELRTLEIQRVAQHPQEWSFAIDIDVAWCTVDLDRELHPGYSNKQAPISRINIGGPRARHARNFGPDGKNFNTVASIIDGLQWRA